MKEQLRSLYNTLALIETKGENTKIMADCLRYVEGMIQKQEHEEERRALDHLKKSKEASDS